jgi:hypothetical protein
VLANAQPENEGTYLVTWFRLGENRALASRQVETIAEARALLPDGPAGWQRYLIERCQFIERGDAFGPRGG